MINDEKLQNTEIKYFEIFQQEAGYWLQYFGLLDWKVTFYHDNLDTERLAETRMDNIGKCASMILAKGLAPSYYTEENVKRTAFHEVCELLLGGLYYQAQINTTSAHEIDLTTKAGHEIIRRLENTVFRDLGSKHD